MDDQEILESNTLTIMCDALTQYDLSHIMIPEEHSYCLTSSPIPSAYKAFHHPFHSLIAADPGSPTASCTESEAEVSRGIYTGLDYDPFYDTAATDTSVTSVELDKTKKS